VGLNSLKRLNLTNVYPNNNNNNNNKNNKNNKVKNKPLELRSRVKSGEYNYPHVQLGRRQLLIEFLLQLFW
jgi:hypothetical protein